MLRGKSYEKNVNSGCELVTPENMYNSEIEKLLFPSIRSNFPDDFVNRKVKKRI